MHYLKARGFVHAQSSEITPRAAYEGRRDLLKLIGTGVAGSALAGWAARDALARAARPGKLSALAGARTALAGGVTMEKPTP